MNEINNRGAASSENPTQIWNKKAQRTREAEQPFYIISAFT